MLPIRLLFLLAVPSSAMGQFDLGGLLGNVNQFTSQAGVNLGGIFGQMGQQQPNTAQSNDQPPRHFHRGGKEKIFRGGGMTN